MGLEKIIVALDVDTKDEVISIVKNIGDRINYYKIGSVIFTSYGPDLIKQLKDMGKKIFLDLKYHDIPNTVVKAISHALNMRVDMITIHTMGGYTMLKEAAKIVEASATMDYNPTLLGVTVLTSMKTADLRAIGMNRKVESQVKKLTIIAKNAGLKGFVCSAKEIKIIRKIIKEYGKIIVPGIRLSKEDNGDQKRVATPAEAIKLGADYLVMGRPILAAKNINNELDLIEREI